MNKEFIYVLEYEHSSLDLQSLGLNEKKIGKASGLTPMNRVNGLNANSPIGLRLVTAIEINEPFTALQVEGILHQAFAGDRLLTPDGRSTEFFNDDNDDLAHRVVKLVEGFNAGIEWRGEVTGAGETGVTIVNPDDDTEWSIRIKEYNSLKEQLLSKGYTTHATKDYVAFRKPGYVYDNVLAIRKSGKMDFWVKKGTDFNVPNGWLEVKEKSIKRAYAAAFRPGLKWGGIILDTVTVENVVETVENIFTAQLK